MANGIEVRCEGKMLGVLNPETLIFVVARGDWVYVCDLLATSRERRPVVERMRVSDYAERPRCGEKKSTG